jgi:CubicO group peptidase (beta-lactamase class C family)
MPKLRAVALASFVFLSSAACASDHGPSLLGATRGQSCTPGNGQDARQIDAIVNAAMQQYGLRAVIVGLSNGSQKTIARAYGESTPGVPATVDMHWRNGAVTHTMMTTLLLEYVDRGVVRLDAPLSTWMPDLPSSNLVTLHMLTNMTSNYFDYVKTQAFLDAYGANPYRAWSPEELIAIGIADPGNLAYAPGTHLTYAHTNYMILQRVLEAIGGAPIRELLKQNVIDPLRLHETDDPSTPALAEPALHSWSFDTGTYQDATAWDPSWGSGAGTSTVCDMVRWARAAGTGALLSPQSHALQLTRAPFPVTPTAPPELGYAMGVIVTKGWSLQTPGINGHFGIIGYLPSHDLSIAIVATQSETVTVPGKNFATTIFGELVKELAPEALPPLGY